VLEVTRRKLEPQELLMKQTWWTNISQVGQPFRLTRVSLERLTYKPR
jgi:hypothetical protein